MLQIKDYVKVSSLDEAYSLNQKKNNVIIGGMHWLKMSRASVGTAIDLSGLGLDEITETEESFEIGCMTSLRSLELHEGLNKYCNNAVRNAVRDIVGVQFRNTATIGGSIFGRYGFSDVLTVFMAMDTYVCCYEKGEISIKEYARMKADRDLIIKLIVRKKDIKIAYLAQRHARTDFPILTCAVSCMDGQWQTVLGARPYKAKLSSSYCSGNADDFAHKVVEEFSFGSNMRASAEYRRDIAEVLIKRAFLLAEGSR